jgi:hypothetical protein
VLRDRAEQAEGDTVSAGGDSSEVGTESAAAVEAEPANAKEGSQYTFARGETRLEGG